MMVEGEYFSWLSHDDVYYPDKVEKQVEILSELENKETIVYSGYEIITPSGDLITQTAFETKHDLKDLNKPLYPFFHLILNGCAMLIHKNNFKKVGVFDTKLLTTQDYDFWLRVLRETYIKYDNNVLLKSRSHSEQGSKLMLNTHIEECNKFWLKAINSLSEDEILDIGGSRLNFYKDMHKSFKENTLYNEVISFLQNKMLEQIILDYKKAQTRMVKEEIVESFTKEWGNDMKNRATINKILDYQEKSKPRIVFFTGNWFDRGGINRVISIISSLLKESYEIFVCCMRDPQNREGYKLAKEITFLELEESVFLYIPELLKLLNVDIFIGSNNCFAPLIKLYEKIENLGIRVIMWNHESYFEPFYDSTFEESIKIRKEVYGKVSIILWLSKLNAFIGKIFNRNTMVMENPLSLTTTAREYLKKKSKNLISVGRFNSPRKRIDRLIRIFAEVLKKKPETKLYIVGQYDLDMKIKCEDKSIQELIEDLKIPKENLIFVGEVKNVEDYYSKACINIMTSEREGFGLTVLEAASFGIPSVVFNSGGAAEILTDQVNGYIVEEDDLNDMVEKILNLLSNEKLYSEISRAAYKLTLQYSQKKVGEKWKDLIEKVLSLKDGELELLEGEFSEEEKMKYLKDTVLLYEKAFEKQKLEIVSKMEDTLSWKSTKILRKTEKLVNLLQTQGFFLTFRNIVLRIKERILN